MYKVSILLVLMFSFPAFSKHYYRFWRGHKVPTLSQQEFVKGLNDLFIPETVEQGRGHGLNAYMPVLVNQAAIEADFPEEMALVVYDTEEKYRAIRKMPRGSRYQELHWDYFQKDESKSRVPQAFTGNVEVETAYDLLESDTNWQKHDAVFQLYKFKDGFNSAAKKELKRFFEKIQSEASKRDLLSYLVLVDAKGVYLYYLKDARFTKKTDIALDPTLFESVVKVPLNTNNKAITWSEGNNRQFLLGPAK